MVYYSIVLLIIIADQMTKAAVRRHVGLGEKRKTKCSFLNRPIYIWHVNNSGGAYGFLKDKMSILLSLSSMMILTLFMILFQSIKTIGSFFTNLFLALILGGALGNMWDRIRRGRVTDFLFIACKKAPIFNVADICIVLGCLFLFVTSLLPKK